MESWISVDKTSGSGNAQIKVTASVNEGADRTTTVIVRTSGDKTASVICSQTGKRYPFDVKNGSAFEGFMVKSGSAYEDFLVLKG